MKLSTNLVHVLKNFAQIHPAVIFQPGTTLRTMNQPGQSMFAVARFDEPFTHQAGIGDIPKLLNLASLFQEPEIAFAKDHLVLTDAKDPSNSAQYALTDYNYIPKPPERDISLTIEGSFILSKQQFSKIQKAIAIYDQPNYVIEGNGEKIFFKTANCNSPVSDAFSIEVGETEHKFYLAFQREDIALMGMDYEVQFAMKAVRFMAIPDAASEDRFETVPIEYFCACTAEHSSFEG